jgi:DNA-binding GntR family transcriptional regulator
MLACTVDHVSDLGERDPRAYVRLAAIVRGQIERSELAPGDPVPSITTMTQEHGVARATAGKALRMLETEGFIHRVPGLGYYVAGRP